MKNVDGLRGIATINKLSLSSNQLENLDGLKGITSISILWLDNNPTLQISYLPPSLLYLLTNFSQLCNFDFKSVPKLRKLYSRSSLQMKHLSLIEQKKAKTKLILSCF